jgi:NAD(P)-dependent dehydrogenase (short-subunit alcohol dehydrogenase family)
MPQTHLIVGASRGIGLEFATQLLSRGDIVIATERGFLSKLRHLKESPNGKNLMILQCDVVNESSIKSFAAEVGKLAEKGGLLEGGVIDSVVLNAGVLEYPNRISEVYVLSLPISSSQSVYTYHSDITCLTPPDNPRSFTSFQHHLATNTIGPLHTAQSLLSLSLHIKTLVFISSDSGSTGAFLSHEDGFGAYSASKAALNQGLRHLACELHRKHVKGEREKTVVLALHPGSFNSAFNPPPKEEPSS